MMNREKLNQTAVELMEKHNFTAPDGKPVEGNDAIFYANIRHAFAVFADRIKGCASDPEIAIAATPVRAACTLYNDEQKVQRLEQLAKMNAKDATMDYLNRRTVSGIKLVYDEKSEAWKTDDTIVPITGSEFVEIVLSAAYNTIADACCIWADNLFTVKHGDDSKSKGTKIEEGITKISMRESLIQLRNDKGWTLPPDKKVGNTYLCNQLNQVIAMITGGLNIKMSNADVIFLADTIFGTSWKITDGVDKDGNKSEAKFVTRNVSTILNAMYIALYQRVNKLSYRHNNQTGADRNAAKSVKNNAAMAESGKAEEFQPLATAPAGPVTIGTAETK